MELFKLKGNNVMCAIVPDNLMSSVCDVNVSLQSYISLTERNSGKSRKLIFSYCYD